MNLHDNSSKKRCSRCLLPHTFPTIRFNSDGVCNFCTRWDAKWENINFENRKRELEKIVSIFRGKTKPCDCVIGLSGGKDSCYVALLSKELGLNPFAVTFDNKFLSEQAKSNIRLVIDKLNIPHVTINYNKEFMIRIYRNSLVRSGEFCSVCNTGIRSSLYKVAKEKKIDLIISGMSPRTEANSPLEFFACSPGYFRNVAKRCLSRKEITDFYFINQYKRIVLQYFKKPYFIFLPNYFPWNEQDFIEELNDKINIDFSLFEQHVDCEMSDAKEYLKYLKFGILEKCAKLSSLIRDGQITRKESLELLNEYEHQLLLNKEKIRKKIIKMLDIEEEFLDAGIKNNHWDYIPKYEIMIRKFLNVFPRYGVF